MSGVATHITQAKTSHYCGQACLAMMAGCTLKEAMVAVGHRRATTQDEIVRAAKKLGLRPLTSGWKVAREIESFPPLAIMKMRRKYRKRGHWCCYVDGVYHDPALPEGGKMGSNDQLVCLMEFERVAVVK